MVDEHSIRDLSERIVDEFQPERVILFGSYATGAPTPDSDVDLLVILAFEGKNFAKSLEILNRTNPSFPIDLLARTPPRYRAPLPGGRPPHPGGPGPRQGVI